tara:strand:+ start:3526 stop:4437 length:912 start_codon:yes stop_codon:yes gene_type:complete
MFWAEKYRPSESINNCTITQYKELLNNEQVPNVLMYGPPGVGKTTLAKLVIKHFQPNVLFTMNAVKYNEEQFKSFCKNKVTVPKILFADEADMLSNHSQHSIVAVSYRYDVRCIFICNDITKIVSQIANSFLVIPFYKYNMTDACNIIRDILKKENQLHSFLKIRPLYSEMNGDMRKIIMYSDYLLNNHYVPHYYSEDNIRLDWLKEKHTWIELLEFVDNLIIQAISLSRFIIKLIEYHIEEISDVHVLNIYLNKVNFIERNYKLKNANIWFCFVKILYDSPLFREYVIINIPNRRCIMQIKI